MTLPNGILLKGTGYPFWRLKSITIKARLAFFCLFFFLQTNRRRDPPPARRSRPALLSARAKPTRSLRSARTRALQTPGFCSPRPSLVQNNSQGSARWTRVRQCPGAAFLKTRCFLKFLSRWKVTQHFISLGCASPVKPAAHARVAGGVRATLHTPDGVAAPSERGACGCSSAGIRASSASLREKARSRQYRISQVLFG